MMNVCTRRGFLAAVGGFSALALTACGAQTSGTASSEASASAADGSATASETASLPAVTVGTLATEDILPLWVAQEQGWFATFGLEADVVTFQSATELIAAVSAGEVDFAMTDIMVAASLFAGGTDVVLEWVTLGTEPQQGRFGIMVGPDSDVQDATQLAGVPIAVGSNTILEYVMDRLLQNAGVPDDQIVVEEIQKLPVRFQAMASGEVAAAALPASLLALGEAQGCRVIIDDTTGENLSQSVMIARGEFMDTAEGAEVLEALRKVWNEAVTGINESPEAFREVLVENANLSEAVAETYPVSDYPVCEIPSAEMVDPVLDWMEQKGYLMQELTYDETTGEFARA